MISGPLFLPEMDEKTGKSYVRYEVSLVMINYPALSNSNSIISLGEYAPGDKI